MAMPQGVQRGISDAPFVEAQPAAGGLDLLLSGRVHEVLGSITPAFALNAAASREGRIFWIGEQRAVHAAEEVRVRRQQRGHREWVGRGPGEIGKAADFSCCGC